MFAQNFNDACESDILDQYGQEVTYTPVGAAAVVITANVYSLTREITQSGMLGSDGAEMAMSFSKADIATVTAEQDTVSIGGDQWRVMVVTGEEGGMWDTVIRRLTAPRVQHTTRIGR